MAKTKQTARKKESIESITNMNPTELEIDTEENESDNMDTTDQDKNEEACLLRTRKEEKFKEIINHYLNSMEEKTKTPVRRDNYAVREEITTSIHKCILLKIEMTEELKRTTCPKLCETHKTSVELEQECKDKFFEQLAAKGPIGTKLKASEKEDFKSPTKTSKQPRKEKEKFQIPISNQFEALTNEMEETPDPTPTQEKQTSSSKIKPRLRPIRSKLLSDPPSTANRKPSSLLTFAWSLVTSVTLNTRNLFCFNVP
ncbi:hypothetical protein NPIL_37851 [Nephila pilipes]|uniref:Uncharacterized protein n=1 Tax=Nephila pilipes TaxID=299642 RepID=A0A8X6N984_NEPPI|nr:hypothetical protein NPIL_37851 [Nephila pilipes]